MKYCFFCFNCIDDKIYTTNPNIAKEILQSDLYRDAANIGYVYYTEFPIVREVADYWTDVVSMKEFIPLFHSHMEKVIARAKHKVEVMEIDKKLFLEKYPK